MSCIYSIDGISRKERERGKKREKRDNVKDKEISWRVRREEKNLNSKTRSGAMARG